MIENLIFSQLLTTDEYARKVLPHLREEYFTNDQRIFLKIYHRFFSKYNKIPSKQTMLLEIDKLKASSEVYNALVELTNATEEFTESVDYLVTKTEEFCREKALYNALRDSVLIIDGSDSKEKRTPEIVPSLLTQALSVCFDTSVGHNYFDDAASRFDYYHSVTARVKTGIPVIDKITRGGFPKKTFNVLLAPPHGGKTLGMVNIGAGALKQGSNVLYITMEMAAEEIGKRFDVHMLGIDFDTLEGVPKDVFTKKFAKLQEGGMGRLVIKEFPTGAASAAHFRQLLAELKTKQNFVPDMIIVDYMNICASEFYKTGSNHNSYTVIGSVGKELRALAIEANAVLLSATQTNRSGVGSSELSMTDVSDSASTSMIADFMLGMITTSELKELNQILFQQIKNRYSGITELERFLMGVDYPKMMLFNLTEDSSHHQSTPSPKKSKLNKGKSTDVEVDMTHQIKPEIPVFDDFKFDE